MKQQRADAYKHIVKRYAITLTKYLLLPVVVYLAIYSIFQHTNITHFTKDFFLDEGDGYQNVWNIWWVNHALEHGQNPYFTKMLDYPFGTTLVPQTMNIYNGIVGFFLIHLFSFSLVEAVNFAVVFSFVASGVTMFWFAQKLFKRYWVSLVAGGLYTFSSFHFAHAIGHLQLISFEWIPLFMLAFWNLLEKLRYRYAIYAALALFLVLLCDYYLLFWSILVATMWFGWKVWKRDIPLTKQTLKVLAVFVFLSMVLVGPLVYSLVHLNKVDPLTGAHDPNNYGLDIGMVLLPGGSSHWEALTQHYWLRLPYTAEASMFFGYGMLTVLAVAFYKMRYKARKFKAPSYVLFWWIVLFTFGVLALGPHPTLYGHSDPTIPLPYDLLQKIFPTLAISGMPLRWTLMALIAAIIITSYMLTRLDVKKRSGLILAVLFVAISFLDLWPVPTPLTPSAAPKYVYALAKLPYGGVLDNAALSAAWQLRDQTIAEKPMPFGYTTRTPQSVANKDAYVFATIARNQYTQLCSVYHIRYVTMPVSRPLDISYPVIYNDGQSLIYDLHSAGGC